MIYLNTDGGARGNPGPAAIGFVIRDEEGKVLKSGGEYIGKTTNNFAEYKALIKGLTEALELGKSVSCSLDSELLVKQLNGEYKVKDPNLKDLFSRVQLLTKNFDQVKFSYVPRNKNKLADKIVNEVLDAA